MRKYGFVLSLLLCLAFVAKQTPNKKKDTLVFISTDYGTMTAVLFDDTPLHKTNFIKLAQEGFYDSTTFHRIIRKFMIQGGDPNSKDDIPSNDGVGGPDYTIPQEIKHPHNFGAIAAARTGDRVNPERASSGSQFYIVENEKGTHQLDGSYTVFGQVIDGLEVIHKIVQQETGMNNRPYKDIKMVVTTKEMSRKKITKKYGYSYPE